MATASPYPVRPLADAAADLLAAPRPALAAAAVILLGVGLAFWPALGNGWVGYDDDVYVTANPRVEGFTAENLRWWWTDTGTFYWHPLAWTWHTAVRSAFGTAPGPHHAAGMALHALAALAAGLLVLAVLPRPGRAPAGAAPGTAAGPAAGAGDGEGRPAGARVVAAAGAALLWAVHPLRAEAVAWVPGQKELLSTLFMLLAGLAWLGRTGPRARAAWWASLAFMAAALLAKPMAVTLPAALLALDAIPLRRLRSRADLRPLLLEKLPHAVLALAALLPSVLDPRQRDFLPTGPAVDGAARAMAVAWGAAFPVLRTLWPQGLSPFHGALPAGTDPAALPRAAAGASLLVLVTVLVVRRARSGHGGPLAAWAAYLALVVPVSGLRQAGAVLTADRFAQTPTLALLPLAGALLLAATTEVARGRAGARAAPAVAAAGIVVVAGALGVMTRRHVPAWRDATTLWTSVLAEGRPPHPVPLQNLGAALLARAVRGDDAATFARAQALFEEALRLDPRHAATLNNMGLLARRRGRGDEAATWFRKAEDADPRLAAAPANLALLLAERGRVDEARAAWRRARATPTGVPPALERRLRAALGDAGGEAPR